MVLAGDVGIPRKIYNGQRRVLTGEDHPEERKKQNEKDEKVVKCNPCALAGDGTFTCNAG